MALQWGVIAFHLHKGSRYNLPVIGVGARSNAFHSCRLKPASRKLICACRSGRRGERCATGLRAGTLYVDAEEALASPPVTGLIPRSDGFSRVSFSFYLRPGLMSSQPSSQSNFGGNRPQTVFLKLPRLEEETVAGRSARDSRHARCQRPQSSDQSFSWDTFGACRSMQSASRLSPSLVSVRSIVEQQAIVSRAHVFEVCLSNGYRKCLVTQESRFQSPAAYTHWSH